MQSVMSNGQKPPMTQQYFFLFVLRCSHTAWKTFLFILLLLLLHFHLHLHHLHLLNLLLEFPLYRKKTLSHYSGTVTLAMFTFELSRYCDHHDAGTLSRRQQRHIFPAQTRRGYDLNCLSHFIEGKPQRRHRSYSSNLSVWI